MQTGDRQRRTPRARLRSRLDRLLHDDTATRPTRHRIDTYEASWSQSWTPVFQTQAIYTRSSSRLPERSVSVRRLGEGVKAQEYVPNDRVPRGGDARFAWYLRGLKGRAAPRLRGYRDSWNINSGAAEVSSRSPSGESRA